MSDHKQAFLETIKNAPMDEVARNIYADWLDEQGEVEEANRQRKFVPALKVLEKAVVRLGLGLAVTSLRMSCVTKRRNKSFGRRLK